jgi:ABC-2 type transport system ATP-binding protein
MSDAHAISAQGLTKLYGSFVAVDDVSFDVEPGEVFALLGPNGAGKTTLIRMLMDITRPDTGSVLVLGKTHDDSLKARIGYLPEERGLYKRAHVGELLQFYARLKGHDGHAAGRLTRALLERLELASWAKKRVMDLSKGMQQKVQFMTALIGEPELLVLDEPFTGLDPVNVRLFEDVIQERRAAGATVLLSTHQMNKIEALCDRALMIHHGHRVLYGRIRDILKDHADGSVWVRTSADLAHAPGVASAEGVNGAVRVTFAPGADASGLLAWMGAQRIEVEEYRQHSLPLEDIFVQVVERAGGAVREAGA